MRPHVGASCSFSSLPFEVGDESLDRGGVLGGAGAGALEVVEGGASVQQRVADPAGVCEQDGNVVTSLSSAVGILSRLMVSDSLLIVMEGLWGISGLAVNDT